MNTKENGCQQEDSREFSRLSIPYPLFLAMRFLWHLKRNGLLATARKVRAFLHLSGARKTCRVSGLPQVRWTAYEEVLRLEPGEWVEVKSEREIQETLDDKGRTRGLVFLPEMNAYYGRRLRVYKRLERVFLEESKQVRTMKNTVLLEGVMCNGFGIGCDRSCFYYWREAWLKRIAPNPGEADCDLTARGENQNQ